MIAERKRLAKDIERELGKNATLYIASQVVAGDADYLKTLRSALGAGVQCFAATSLAINAKTGAVVTNLDDAGLPKNRTLF